MVVDSDWRQRVRDLVNDIIAPDALEWMDDDETLTDEAYARRALIDMQARFAKSVPFPRITPHRLIPFSGHSMNVQSIVASPSPINCQRYPVFLSTGPPRNVQNYHLLQKV